MTNETDPRPYYERALRWANGVVLGVDPATLDGPTPCPDYDVRTLLGHLAATVDRARVIGEGGDPRTMPTVVSGVPDDGWADALAAAVEKMSAVWADDALLESPVTVPWGTVPGRAALWGYVNEALVHGWDLAVATGQDAEADPDLAEATFAGARAKIPADRRGGPIPFAQVVASAPDAGPTERLANWSGHRRR
jgi:uncharacterized protein (TIGR03086 family)